MIHRVASLATVVVLLAACGASPAASPSAPSPTATPPSQPTATQTSSPVPTATGAAPSEFPTGLCCKGKDLEAGAYRIPGRLQLDVSVEIPAGWRVIREDAASVLALVRGTNALGDASEYLAVFALDDGDASAFQQSVLEMVGFEVVSGPADVRIAEFDGWQVNLAAMPNPDNAGAPDSGIPPGTQVVPAIQDTFTEGFAWTTATPEARVTIVTLQIDGRVGVFYLEAPADVADVSIDEMLTIVASLRPA